MSRANTKASKRVSNKRSETNPFDSDSELDLNYNPPAVEYKDRIEDKSWSSTGGFSSTRNQYKNDFRDSGGLENQSMQELENYAVYKAVETTETVKRSLKVAEEIRGSASSTLVALHQQGQQIERTHMMAIDIDQELGRSEKLLGSLGGIFSRKWKPNKTRPIKGPLLTRDDSFIRKSSHLEQKQKLGLSNQLLRSSEKQTYDDSATGLRKVEVEKVKQDDALSNISDILSELKVMAIDMGSEINRHSKALGDMEGDMDELNYRVKGANERGRRLLGK